MIDASLIDLFQSTLPGIGEAMLLGTLRLPQSVRDQRLAEWENGRSTDEHYRANAVVRDGEVVRRIPSYVKVPAVRRNAVGSVLADVGYLAMPSLGANNPQLSMVLSVELDTGLAVEPSPAEIKTWD